MLRDDFSPASDVDVLVEFEPDHVPGPAFFSMEEELSQIIVENGCFQTKSFNFLLPPEWLSVLLLSPKRIITLR